VPLAASAENASPEDVNSSERMAVEPFFTGQSPPLILSARFFYVTVVVVALASVTLAAWAVV
jgi:hypothetical protein